MGNCRECEYPLPYPQLRCEHCGTLNTSAEAQKTAEALEDERTENRRFNSEEETEEQYMERRYRR